MVCFETLAVYTLKIQVPNMKTPLVLLFIDFYETGSYYGDLVGLEHTEIFLPLSAEC